MKKPRNPRYEDKINAIKVAEQENSDVKSVESENIEGDIKGNNERITNLTNLDLIVESERFGTLDFSKSDEEFREKNMEFFEELENIYNVNILKNNGNIDYYSLLQFENKEGKEFIVPMPVFFDIIGSEFFEEREGYNDKDGEHKKFLLQNFNIEADTSEDRLTQDEIKEVEEKKYYQEIGEKLKNGEEVSQEDIDNFIYLNKLNKENTGYNEEIFDYGVPVENFINYIFDDTYYNGWLTEIKKSEVVLGEELKKYFSIARVDKLKDYAEYGNLDEWARNYASNELENRFDKNTLSYKETPENEAEILREEKEFAETLSNFRERFGDDMVIIEHNNAAGYITYNHRGHNIYKDKFAMDEMNKGKQPYDTCYVIKGDGRGGRVGWNHDEIAEFNKSFGINVY